MTNNFSACQREEAEKRLSALGLTRIYLPGFNTTKPKGPHIPILAPAPSVLKNRKRIIVLINDDTQDLGILSYSQLQGDLGLNGGSIINFVKEIITRSVVDEYDDIFADGEGVKNDEDIPALVVLNTGQLLYSHKYNRALSLRSWSAMPRKSVVHEMVCIHETENRVKRHYTSKEHIESVFNDVLCNTDRVSADAEIYVVAIENGADNMIAVLTNNCMVLFALTQAFERMLTDISPEVEYPYRWHGPDSFPHGRISNQGRARSNFPSSAHTAMELL